ncbi:uncharacterized protein FOMMEDRAFT_152406 [Fomitiporia mediterranea MF3/22]|uniref:uncharacterized protein n=1 Tax=Fomitiporia mediterranea (strain MF3/22) TaxID=694068 RepID=UPI0004408B81|nr:uncharacterized protein FOMMEDRAFT_152406 [Fomitiporia mediterranea MF3/22]EJD07058.1 hypothetical protein FOMMEDRAFT_152406 [Fomitiporia mediterranea MF3/22]
MPQAYEAVVAVYVINPVDLTGLTVTLFGRSRTACDCRILVKLRSCAMKPYYAAEQRYSKLILTLPTRTFLRPHRRTLLSNAQAELLPCHAFLSACLKLHSTCAGAHYASQYYLFHRQVLSKLFHIDKRGGTDAKSGLVTRGRVQLGMPEKEFTTPVCFTLLLKLTSPCSINSNGQPSRQLLNYSYLGSWTHQSKNLVAKLCGRRCPYLFAVESILLAERAVLDAPSPTATI